MGFSLYQVLRVPAAHSPSGSRQSGAEQHQRDRFGDVGSPAVVIIVIVVVVVDQGRADAELGSIDERNRHVRRQIDARDTRTAIGPERKLSELAGRLRQGPLWSDVRGFEEQEAPMLKYEGFHIRH